MFQYLEGCAKNPSDQFDRNFVSFTQDIGFSQSVTVAKASNFVSELRTKAIPTLVQFLANKLQQPYVNEVWIGGLLTN